MSEPTVTLRDYFDTRLADFRSHISDTFAERDKAITEFKEATAATINEFKDATKESFASRNEIQTAMKNASDASERATAKLTSTFITRAEAITLMFLACTITATIVGVITFFMRK